MARVFPSILSISRMAPLMSKRLPARLSTFGQNVRATIDETDALDDKDTADIFTEISRGIDKWLWFVEAHSQAVK